ncbi:hypothetical protein DM02DRAFT_607989 [Periconia macrospinosa]|uniref:Thioesterase/thiol ester dehydrase-isomerase n=1 Tax=Periconia macrospinosa TaxID=97972 RepID=A0A2V1EGX9_9PLEO|nr:hypothetical protein DM02DRAFT_607989 [Periconia macrospinosa]
MAPAMSVLATSIRSTFAQWLKSVIGGPGAVWKILALLFALGNIKNATFVWHFRFFKAYTYHLYRQPTKIPPSALFQPVVTTSHTPITEMDYNMHKSNSTYFADMDISRTHLFSALMRNAILKAEKRQFAEKQARRGPVGKLFGNLGLSWPRAAGDGTTGYMIALGGVSCNFKREILPYKKYEMWTRLLTWDRKWFYLVTWIVKPGYGQAASFSLQPWRKVKGKKFKSEEELSKAVYATAIAKYVIKKGRITVPTEQALFDAEMVPEKPEGWVYNEAAAEKADGEWNWDVIEKERRRGLAFAEAFLSLDGLNERFDGGKEGGVLGEFTDLF